MAKPETLESRRMLIVEDEIAYAETIKDVFGRYAIEVRLAVNAGEALRKIKEWQPHLIILDVMMPYGEAYEDLQGADDKGNMGTGFRVLGEIRKWESHKQILAPLGIALTTSRAGAPALQQAWALLKPNGWIFGKPYDDLHLEAFVCRALGLECLLPPRLVQGFLKKLDDENVLCGEHYGSTRKPVDAWSARLERCLDAVTRDPKTLAEIACDLLEADLGLLIRLVGKEPKPELIQVYPASCTELITERLSLVRDLCMEDMTGPYGEDMFLLEDSIKGPDGREHQGVIVAFRTKKGSASTPRYALVAYGDSRRSQIYTSRYSAAAQSLVEVYEPESISTARIGEYIDGYRVVRSLGKGGMGEVFLVESTGVEGIKKQLALKKIVPEHAADARYIKRFLSEAGIATQFHHPNVVTIWECRESAGSPYIVMEYIDGVSLRELIRQSNLRKSPVPSRIAAKIVSEVCEGLLYVHGLVDQTTRLPLSIVHRDISPENILLSWDGYVKIVDFGLAHATDQLHRSESGFKGKRRYAPPEQIEGRPVDGRADIYAVGVMLFELITGTPERTGSTQVTHLEAADELAKIVAKACAEKREERYSSCREVKHDLLDFIGRDNLSVEAAQVKEWIESLCNKNQSTQQAQVSTVTLT